MPEGDTLHRIANRLRPVLVGQTLLDATARPRGAARAVDAGLLIGRRVESVGARGKHLFIAIDNRRVLHSHLGMTGSWHVYTIGAAWRKPESQAALTLSTASRVVVNFNPKRIELGSLDRLTRDAYLNRLGPDLLLDTTDAAAILPRLRVHDRSPIGEAVMNQTIVAGIGNVYKSESLFLARINPWRAVGRLSDEQLIAYLQHTQQLMRRNLGPGMRTTRFAIDGRRVWVYGRRDQACLVCGAGVQMSRQGDQGRSTYWCPTCQPHPAD